jgi:flagellar hook-associated protein 3 FlgL
MRIPNMTMAEGLVDRLNSLRTKQNQINSQLATGQRINLASEDPQAASRVISLRSEVSITQLYARNASVASSISETTGSALGSLFTDVYLGATEVVASASSGNVNDSQRAAYATTVNQLILQAVQLGNTRFNQQYLFNGSAIDTAPFRVQGDSSRPTAVLGPDKDDAGNAVDPLEPITIKIADSLELSPYNSGGNNQKIGAFIQRLVDLRDALLTNNSDEVRSKGEALKQSEQDLANMIAENGAQASRLESLSDSMAIRFANITEQTARETSVDIAEAMVNLTKVQTAYQAAMQAGAQILRLSLLDYIR